MIPPDLIFMGQLARLIKDEACSLLESGEITDGLHLKQLIMDAIEAHGYVCAFPPLLACGKTILHQTPTEQSPIEIQLPCILDIGMMNPTTGLIVDTAIKIGPHGLVDQCALVLQQRVHLRKFNTFGALCCFMKQIIDAYDVYAVPDFAGHQIKPFDIHGNATTGIARHQRRSTAPLEDGTMLTIEPLLMAREVPLVHRLGNVFKLPDGEVPCAVTRQKAADNETIISFKDEAVEFTQYEHTYYVYRGALVRIT